MSTCDNCGKEANHIVMTAVEEYCEHCGGIQTTGGVRTDGLASRSIFSIRESQKAMEGDLITPYVVDQNTGKMVVNEEFIRLYPDQAHQYYTEEQLEAEGLDKLAEKVAVDRDNFVNGQDDSDVQFSGEFTEEAVKRLVDAEQ
jgi:hypothetical protein